VGSSKKKGQTPPRIPSYDLNTQTNMNTKELNRIGVPHGEAMKRAHAFIVAFTVVAGGDDPGAGLNAAGYNLPDGEYMALLTHS
jgi:hypothetical protein